VNSLFWRLRGQALNQRFLDDAIRNRYTVKFPRQLNYARPEHRFSTWAAEIDYLQFHGYRMQRDGLGMVPPP
jgi:hypothetical protein